MLTTSPVTMPSPAWGLAPSVTKPSSVLTAALMEISRLGVAPFARLVEHQYPNLQGSRQGAALDVLEREHPNIEYALQWSVKHEPHWALELAGNTWRFWLYGDISRSH